MMYEITVMCADDSMKDDEAFTWALLQLGSVLNDSRLGHTMTICISPTFSKFPMDWCFDHEMPSGECGCI